jgi:tRNA 2-thiouridine synthesizing protein A
MNNTTSPNKILDTTGQLCPYPLANTKQELSKLHIGDTLQVISSDPSFMLDVQVFSSQTGNKLLKLWENGDLYYILIEKHV